MGKNGTSDSGNWFGDIPMATDEDDDPKTLAVGYYDLRRQSFCYTDFQPLSWTPLADVDCRFDFTSGNSIAGIAIRAKILCNMEDNKKILSIGQQHKCLSFSKIQ